MHVLYDNQNECATLSSAVWFVKFSPWETVSKSLKEVVYNIKKQVRKNVYKPWVGPEALELYFVDLWLVWSSITQLPETAKHSK